MCVLDKNKQFHSTNLQMKSQIHEEKKTGCMCKNPEKGNSFKIVG